MIKHFKTITLSRAEGIILVKNPVIIGKMTRFLRVNPRLLLMAKGLFYELMTLHYGSSIHLIIPCVLQLLFRIFSTREFPFHKILSRNLLRANKLNHSPFTKRKSLKLQQSGLRENNGRLLVNIAEGFLCRLSNNVWNYVAVTVLQGMMSSQS